jgi:NAD(P)-dependent dehydrogenase (short-subunit alcohol dehydrogenase family)
MSDPLDFAGKTVLVVGGSSGIGNGIAHGFRKRGAAVHVTGTRTSAGDYRVEDGSDLADLVYHSVDVARPGALPRSICRSVSMWWCCARARCATTAKSSRARAGTR